MSGDIEHKGGAAAQASGVAGMCDALCSGQGGSPATALAADILAAYGAFSQDERIAFFKDLLEHYDSDDGETVALPRQASAPRRQELIRRLNMAPSGTAAIVAMRADLLGAIEDHPALAAIDTDFSHLLASWFNTGILELRRIDLSTPAAILEKFIRHEGVHEITDWDDLHRRIDPGDRRLYAFFHPVLADEPLIFVEVALITEVLSAIAPILDGEREEIPAADATVAAFYSLSSCQKGLGGISFGSFLIKRVVEDLAREFPNLKIFATLSPIPNFMAWLDWERAKKSSPIIDRDAMAALSLMDQPNWHLDSQLADQLCDPLVALLSYYLLCMKDHMGKPFDPVARLHFRNGARLERINWLADTSEKGLTQSAGMMVNYHYDIRDIENNRQLYANEDRLVVSQRVSSLLKHSG